MGTKLMCVVDEHAWMVGRKSQRVCPWHLRSERLVPDDTWYSLALHVVRVVQVRSVVSDGGAASHSAPEHVDSAEHWRSLSVLLARLSYCAL
jgi:hypothetical protein